MFYLLKKEGLTMDDFHYEIKKLTRIRKAIPKPDENTLMQKVVTKETMNRYLGGKYAGQVGGSVAIASDTKHLKTFEDYYGLRLDYKLSNGKYEFYLEERIKFTDGDEIWEVFNDGTQRLRGVYNEDLGKFISK